MLAEMDEGAVAASICSISDHGVHFGDDAAARALARECNEVGAKVVHDNPSRFGLFAVLPLPDVDGAVINNDLVEKAGLKFSDALAQDDPADPNSRPYVNVFAARAEDKDNPTYQKLVKIYQTTKAVQDGVLKVSGGSAELVQTPVADLVSSLAKVEKDTKAQK